MLKYHINPETGKPGRCTAVNSCPFNDVSEHYSSLEDANSAYEKIMASSTVAPAARKAALDSRHLPRQIFEEVDKKLEGSGIKIGDKVLIKGVYLPVLDSVTGYKYNTVTIPDLRKGERTVNLPLTEEHAVQVRVETKESIKARSLAQENQDIKNLVELYRPRKGNAVKAIEASLASGNPFTNDQLNMLAEANAQDTIMERFETSLSEVREEHPDEEQLHRIATTRLRLQLQDEIIEKAANSKLADSDSSNLIERNLHAVKAKFVAQGHSAIA